MRAYSRTDKRGVVRVFDRIAYEAPFLAALRANPNDSTLHRPEVALCAHTGRMWDDAVITSWTPAPSGRCPFEMEHTKMERETQ